MLGSNVADRDPGCFFWPLDKGSGATFYGFDSTHISGSLRTIVFDQNTEILCQLKSFSEGWLLKKLNNLKVCKIYCYKNGKTTNLLFPSFFSWNRNPRSGMKKIRIRDEHPGSATLLTRLSLNNSRLGSFPYNWIWKRGKNNNNNIIKIFV